MHQFVFQGLGFGEVFDQYHQATVARRQWLVDGRFMQVQPAVLTVQAQALLVQVFVGNIGEAEQQATPGFANGGQARANNALGGNAGELFHGLVPHEDLLILG
ncbi:hypothetical protein D3C77_496820 [compost metagenome]